MVGMVRMSLLAQANLTMIAEDGHLVIILHDVMTEHLIQKRLHHPTALVLHCNRSRRSLIIAETYRPTGHQVGLDRIAVLSSMDPQYDLLAISLQTTKHLDLRKSQAMADSISNKNHPMAVSMHQTRLLVQDRVHHGMHR